MNLLEFSKDNPPPVGTPDKFGTAFDPSRHVPRVHPKTQQWMPRSPGRRVVPAAAASPAQPPSASAGNGAAGSAHEVTVQDLLPELTTAPTPPAAPTPPPSKAPASAPSNTPPPPPATEVREVFPAANSAADDDDDDGDGAGPTPAAGPSAPTAKDICQTREAAAELAARATYAVTGVIIGDHKKATATGAEHEALKRGYASFFEYRNIVLVGGIALGAVVIAYLLGEARREEVTGVVTGLFRRKPKNVGPVVDVDPAPSPSRPAQAAPAAADVAPSRVDTW